MSDREYRRGEVLGRVMKGELRLRDAAGLLGVSYRQAKRLLGRFRARGRAGLVHGGVGQRSNRGYPPAAQERVLEIVTACYGGPARGPGQRFGPTLAAEHLFSDHGILVPVPTLRRWMVAAKLWGRLRKSQRRFRRRERRAHRGELVQLDGSFHAWLEGRGPVACLITMIDDATGTTLGQFSAEETTWDAARVLRQWIERYGVPQAVYVDASSVFVRAATVHEAEVGIAPLTQFGRMCQKLGIALIVAKTPQAKGRVERVHGTNQDRLVKKMRLRHIADYAVANQFLIEDYWAAHNRRFAVPAAAPGDFHMRLPPRLDLATVFCLETERVVGNDWVVRYENRALQIHSAGARRFTGPKGKVIVRETESGALSLIARSLDGAEHALTWIPAPAATSRRAAVPRVAREPAIPAGLTRAGKPQSAKQLAARAKWQYTDGIRVRAALARREAAPGEQPRR